MATTLGISAYYHDAAAAIVRDGHIVAAAQEERFSRRKHDPSFPRSAVNYCMEEAQCDADDIDAVVFYDNPLASYDRIVQNALTVGPSARKAFVSATAAVLGNKVWINDDVRRAVGGLGSAGRTLIARHHLAHAASAYYPSPFESAAVLTMDGVGEWATTSLGIGQGRDLQLFAEIDYPHSLGLLYSAFTYYCGFKVNSGEYKLMGLAPYGKPCFAQTIRDRLIDIRDDGSYRIDTSYMGYLDGEVMTNERFDALFGKPARKPESAITRHEMNIAASVQAITEEVVLKTARHLRRVTGLRQLVMAGGVALNCVANGKLLASGIFDDIWIQPAAGDAGGALGAALLGQHMVLDVPRPGNQPGRDRQKGSYLGPQYSSAEIKAFLDRHGHAHVHVPDLQTRCKQVAECIAGGGIVGWMSGRMEFGPRSLGARSLLGDPRDQQTQQRMNLKIKFRESFRPFAPSVLVDRCADYFDLSVPSPYMLLVAPVRAEHRLQVDMRSFEDGDDDMLQVIAQARSDVPAVTHVDYTARIQTVDPDTHPAYHALLKAFEALTGHGLLVNTSFNVRGEPIVCTPQDAYRCFMRTHADLLVMEDFLVWRKDQSATEVDEAWKQTYELD